MHSRVLSLYRFFVCLHWYTESSIKKENLSELIKMNFIFLFKKKMVTTVMYLYTKHYFNQFSRKALVFFSRVEQSTLWNALTILTGKNYVYSIYSIQYKNGYLAASDLFRYMFTQSIKFHTFYYHVPVLKSTYVWKLWFIK